MTLDHRPRHAARCPSPTWPSVRRAHPRPAARAPRRADRASSGCTPSRRWPPWPRPGSSACSSTRSAPARLARTRRPPRHLARRRGRRADRRSPGPRGGRRSSWARRSSPSCASSSWAASSTLPLSTVERAGTGDLVVPHDQRRRGALARRAVRHPVAVRRRRHRRRITVVAAVPHRLAGRPADPRSACRSSGSRPGATCGTPPTATCASGPPTPCSTASSPRPSTAPAPSTRSRSAAGAGARFDEALRELLRRRALHPGPAAALVPAGRVRLLRCRSPATLLWGGWLVAQRPRRPPARSPPSRSTCSRWPARSTSCSCWLDEIQVGATSLARVIGIADVPPDRDRHRRDARRRPTSRSTTCATPTAPAATCCAASRSTCGPASGSPSSGRPAPASRRSAG